MKKRILLIRSLDILTDSRVQRYERWFEKSKIPYKILGWDREAKQIKRDHTDYCEIQAGYNLGSSGIKYRIKWNIYVLRYLLRHRKVYDVIHACDFDTILPALCMKALGKWVVFDIFDWFSDEVKTGKKLIDQPINRLEKLATQLADLTIICEEERIKQMGITPKKYIVIPNIPNVNYDLSNEKAMNQNKKITVGYVGGFYPDRGLQELLEVVSQMPHVALKIAGFGRKEIEEEATQMSKDYPNITYYGKVEYSQAIEIMNDCDLLYAMYYKENRNNVYAAPNKFYESIFLGKPIVTTQGTLVGDKVIKHQTGYVIEEGKEPLRILLNGLDQEKIRQKLLFLNKYNKIYKDRFVECMKEYERHIQK